MDYTNRIPEEDEQSEPFLEPEEVSANFASWQEAVVEQDNYVPEVFFQKTLPVTASTFTDPPRYHVIGICSLGYLMD